MCLCRQSQLWNGYKSSIAAVLSFLLLLPLSYTLHMKARAGPCMQETANKTN